MALADPRAYRESETTLVTVWGDVRQPGVHEARLGTPLRQVIDQEYQVAVNLVLCNGMQIIQHQERPIVALSKLVYQVSQQHLHGRGLGRVQ